MIRRTAIGAEGPARSLTIALTSVLALLVPLLSPLAAPGAGAHHGGIMLPFEAGAEWYVSQGYNTSPEEGWSHYNCDPKSGKDAISQSTRCDDGWQYKYSFDLRRVDGEEAGQPVLSPATGAVRWIDPAYGGLSIDLGDGYAVAFFHVDLARGIAVGDELRAGQRVGHVSGPGGGGNGGTPHIHLTVWKTEDGGNWSRTAVPFSDDHPLEGRDFPALPDRERNQHLNAVLASSNAPAASTSVPEAPVPVAPADGATVARRELGAFVWEPTLDAAEYQVVIDGGERTGPWVARPRWDPGDLPEGTYTWQVRARNDTGESALSQPRTLIVGTTASSTPAATPAATPVAVAQPAEPATLGVAAAQATVGTRLTTNGTGFAPGETVRLFWDGAAGPLVAEATANDGGAFTVSVPIPAAPAGDHQIVARGKASHATAEDWVEVIPSIAAEPPVAPPGAEVRVTLRGFGADEPVALSWAGEGGPNWGSGRTDAKGSLRLTVATPDQPTGLYDLHATGDTTGARALGAFRLGGEEVARQATAGEGRLVAPGTFRVTATVLGLIGGTTSSGEIIDPDDRLVALPACTNTSCPWLEPGVPDELFGTRIECGDECFVRVTNPDTGACAVAPVLETGPWFTLDDWWNPTAERALNRLPSATSQLAQGYPGAEAAQDGLDVGYGRSPDGIGISNKGYVVGNRAALDLSNRTWQDIGLDLAVGVAEVEATMLWLSDEEPAQAAEACGRPLDGWRATPAASPEPNRATPVANEVETGARRNDAGRVSVDRGNDSGTGREGETARRSGVRRLSQDVDGDRATDGDTEEQLKQEGGRDGHAEPTAASEPAVRRAGGADAARDEHRKPADADHNITPARAPADEDGLPDRNEGTRALRGYRTPGGGAVDAAQAAPAVAVPEGSGFDAGTVTTTDAGASGERDGAPLPRRIAGLMPQPRVEAPPAGGTGLPPVPAAPDGSTLVPTVSAAVPSATPAAAEHGGDGTPADPESGQDADRDRDRGDPEEGDAAAAAPVAAEDTPADAAPTPSLPPDEAPADDRDEEAGDEARARDGNREPAPEAAGDGDERADRESERRGEDPRDDRRSGRDDGVEQSERSDDGSPEEDEAAAPADAATPEVPAPAPESAPPTDSSPPPPIEPTASDPASSTAEPTAPGDAATAGESATPPDPAESTPSPPEPTPTNETPIPVTPEPTPEPVATEPATPAPTPPPAETAPVETRIFLPVADTTVWTSDPARAQEPMQASVLPVGGPDGAAAYLTFQVEGLAPGTAVLARLVVVGAVGFGGPITVGALPGTWIDEVGLTSGAVPASEAPALGADGAPAPAAPIWVGTEAVFDVSGTVSADGVVTFVVRGTPDAGQALGSRESGLPARLEVTAGWAT